jgi:hypothetical protein
MSKINGFFLFLFGAIVGMLITSEIALNSISKAKGSPPFSSPTVLAQKITWTEAQNLVSNFHRVNKCLYGEVGPNDTIPPGGKPPYLLSWFIDRESLDSCLADYQGKSIDGIRLYPVEITSQDAAGKAYKHHSLVFVPTLPDTMSNGDIVHNNVKKAWDFTGGCPEVCNRDSLTRLGDDYVPPY